MDALKKESIVKGYKTTLLVVYGASLVSFILAVTTGNEGTFMDIVTYLFIAVLINIFKNKVIAIISIVLSSLQLLFVFITILAGSSGNFGALTILISVIVLIQSVRFLRSIKDVKSIKNLKNL